MQTNQKTKSGGNLKPKRKRRTATQKREVEEIKAGLLAVLIKLKTDRDGYLFK